MRTNYLLIDFESVQPEILDLLDQPHFRLMIFVGSMQTRLAFDLAAAVQRLGNKAAYIKISGNGPNALDFHIAYYIGKLASADSAAYFHIISKDKGFDPLIQHLKQQNIFAARYADIADIPVIKTSNAKSLTQKVALVLERLKTTKARPKTIKTLSSTINSYFQNQLAEDEVKDLWQALEKGGFLAVAGTRVNYKLTE